jgi:hypothetical protein
MCLSKNPFAGRPGIPSLRPLILFQTYDTSSEGKSKLAKFNRKRGRPSLFDITPFVGVFIKPVLPISINISNWVKYPQLKYSSIIKSLTEKRA